ncbi:long-chain fatty acid--CoA ligase [Candidatus Atribacteria bacterium MT.SAG.1]|nr:long-chain fatty acid--CoA ligase [Candidatus Atribacteria bacterium MT.SAG.1]
MYIDFLIKTFKENKRKTAIIFKENEYSYEWLLDNYNRWTRYINKKSIERNSVVALKADFNPDAICLLLALIENSCILVPISSVVKNLQKYLDIAEVNYFVNLNNEEPILKNINIKVKHKLLLELIKNRKNPGLILFSSGTTGEPKAALHDIVSLLQKFKVKRKTLRTITFLLFDHIGGFNTLFYILSNAGTIATLQDRSPEETCKIIAKHKVELLPTSPTFLNMILFSRAYQKYDISCLKLITYGTEPMPETTLKELNRILPNVKLKQTYGLSELGIMRSKSEKSDSLWVKVGGEDYKTKIIDGKLWIKAKTAMLGYLNAPSPFTKDGWFNTGDKVEVKGEYIKFLGRESEIINVGGQKVYPTEVESVLLEIDGVKDVIVHGEKNQLMGEIVVANVKVNKRNNNKKYISLMKKYCRGKLEKYKIPIKINLTQKDLNSLRFKRIR